MNEDLIIECSSCHKRYVPNPSPEDTVYFCPFCHSEIFRKPVKPVHEHAKQKTVFGLSIGSTMDFFSFIAIYGLLAILQLLFNLKISAWVTMLVAFAMSVLALCISRVLEHRGKATPNKG
jgi:DNA-directed RNA polymerase subunit RPC12/RpoP